MKFLAHKRLLAIAFSCLTAGVTPYAHECSDATLHGGYAYTVTGTEVSNGPVGPVDVLGKITLDGKGTFAGSATVSLNGTIIKNLPVTGTYGIASDCTGTATVFYPAFTANFSLVLVDGGREAEFIETDEGTVAAETMKPTPGAQE